MTLRELPRTAVIVVLAAVILLVIGYSAVFLRGHSDAGEPVSQSYFTTDDSSPAAALAGLFAESADKLAPFTKDNKTAYRAHVYSTDGGQTRWVGYLSRYTPQRQDEIQRLGGVKAFDTPRGLHQRYIGVEIKRPGDKNWIPADDKDAEGILDVRPPAGAAGTPLELDP